MEVSTASRASASSLQVEDDGRRLVPEPVIQRCKARKPTGKVNDRDLEKAKAALALALADELDSEDDEGSLQPGGRRQPIQKGRSCANPGPHWASAATAAAGDALGGSAATRPWMYLLACLLAVAACLPGLSWLRGDSSLLLPFLRVSANLAEDFAFVSHRYHTDFELGNGSFPVGRVSRLLFTPTSGSIMAVPFLKATLSLQRELANLTAGHEGALVSVSDLCVRTSMGGPCDELSFRTLFSSQALDLDSLSGQSAVQVGTRLAQLLPSKDRALLLMQARSAETPDASVLGNAAAVGRLLATGGGLRMSVVLRPGAASHALERRISEWLVSKCCGADVRASGLLAGTSTMEVEDGCQQVLWLSLLAVLASAFLAAGVLGTHTRKRGQTQVLPVFATVLLVPPLATFSSFGLLGYVGAQVPALGAFALLPALALALRGVFLVAGALREAGPRPGTAEALSCALRGVAPSLLLATVVSALFFGAAAAAASVVGLPAGVRFSALLWLACVGSQLGVLILSPALLAIGERSWARTPEDSLAVWWCAQLHRSDVGGPLHHLITGDVSVLPERIRALPFVVVPAVLVVLVVGAFLLPDVGLGATPAGYLVGEPSTAEAYTSALQSHFQSAELAEVALLLPTPDLESAAYRESLVTLAGNLANVTGVVAMDCWLVELAARLPSDATYRQVADALSSYFASQGSLVHQRDVQFRAIAELRAARCRLMVLQPTSWSALAAQGSVLRGLVEGASIVNGTLYDTGLASVGAWHDELQVAFAAALWPGAAAVVVLLFCVLPLHLAYMSVLTLGFVVATVVLAFAGLSIRINAVTYALTLVAAALATDSVLHLAVAAAQSGPRGSSWSYPLRRALQLGGFEIITSGLVAITGTAFVAVPLRDVGFREWAGLFILVQAMGGLGAALVLPSLASVAERLDLLVRGSVQAWPEEYLVDNRLRQDSSRGLHRRRSRHLEDVDTTVDPFPWGDVVRGKEHRSGWFHLADGGWLPVGLDGMRVLTPVQELEAEYMLDNRELQARSKGLRHRLSRDSDAVHPTEATLWFDRVTGIDLRDGHFRTSFGTFLPTELEGKRILRPEKEVVDEFVLDNRVLQARCRGIRLRTKRKLRDVDRDTPAAYWGHVVRGIDLQDGWLRLEDGTRFLPTHINGIAVLTPKASMSAEELMQLAATAAKARQNLGRNPHEDLPRRDIDEAEPADLPRPWQQGFDRQLKRPYFFNTETGQRSWGRPAAHPKDSGLPHGWQEERDPHTGMTYFVDTVNNISSWVHPSAQDGQLRQAAWEELTDVATGKPYYFDRSTGETTWTKPLLPDDECASNTSGLPPPLEPAETALRALGGEEAVEDLGPPPALDDWDSECDPPPIGSPRSGDLPADDGFAVAGQAAEDEDPSLLPPGWQALADPSSGSKYYVNVERGITQWDAPGAKGLAQEEVLDGGEDDWELPLPAGWEEVMDAKFGKYYVHREKNVTQWERPQHKVFSKVLPAGWQAAYERSTGRIYYLNVALELTQWETPRDEASFVPELFTLRPSVGTWYLPAPRSPTPLDSQGSAGAEVVAETEEEPKTAEAEAGRPFTLKPSVATWHFSAPPTAAAVEVVSEAGTKVPDEAGGSEAQEMLAALQTRGAWSSGRLWWPGGQREAAQEPEPVLQEFLVLNELLKSEAPGLRHRCSRSMLDFHPTGVTAWGLPIRGTLDADGWLELRPGEFVPLEIDGLRVLFAPAAAEEWMIHPAAFHSRHASLTYRNSRDPTDVARSALLHGAVVRGEDLGDGWVRALDGLFLPLRLGGTRLLARAEEVRRWERGEVDSGPGVIAPPPSLPPPPPLPPPAELQFSTFTGPTVVTCGGHTKGPVAEGMVVVSRVTSVDPLGVLGGLIAVFVLLSVGIFTLEGDAWIGFLRVKVDFLHEFAPRGTSFMSSYQASTNQFGEHWDQRLFFTPTDETVPLTTKAFLAEGQALEQHFRSQLRTPGGRSFEQLCKRRSGVSGDCELLSFFDILLPLGTGSLEAAAAGLDGAAEALPLAERLLENVSSADLALLPGLVGQSSEPWPGASAPASSLARWLAGARGVQTLLLLRAGSESLALERTMEDAIYTRRQAAGAVILSGEMEHSLDFSVVRLLDSVVPWAVPGSWAAAALLAVLLLSELTRVPTHLPATASAVLVACAVPGLAACAAWGVIGLCGLSLTVLSVLAVVPAFFCGLGWAAVLASTWRACGPDGAGQKQLLGKTLRNSGPAIASAACAAAAALIAGSAAVGTVPALAVAGLTGALTLIFTAGGLLVSLPALLAVSEHCRRQEDVEARRHRCVRQLLDWLGGWSALGPAARSAWLRGLAPLPMRSLSFRLFATALACAMAAAGVTYTSRLSGGLDDAYLHAEDGALVDVRNVVRSSFDGLRLLEVDLMLEDPNAAAAGYAAALTELLTATRARADVADVDCWYEGFADGLPAGLSEAEASIQLFSLLASDDGSAFVNDAGVVNGELQAARCRVWVSQPLDPEAALRQAQELQALAVAAPLAARFASRAWASDTGRLAQGDDLLVEVLVSSLVAAAVVLVLVLPLRVAAVAIPSCILFSVSYGGFVQASGAHGNVVTAFAMASGIAFCADLICILCWSLPSADVRSDKRVLALVDPDSVGRWGAQMTAALSAVGHEIFLASICAGAACIAAAILGLSHGARFAAGLALAAVALASVVALVVLPGCGALVGDILALPGHLCSSFRTLKELWRWAGDEARAEAEARRALAPRGTQDLGRPKLSSLSDPVHGATSRCCRLLGLAVARAPWCTLLLGLVLTAVLVSGLHWIEGESQLVLTRISTDFVGEFSDRGSALWRELEAARTPLPRQRRSVLLVEPKVAGGLTAPAVLEAGLRLQRRLSLLKATHDGRDYRFEDVCSRSLQGGGCELLSLFSLLVPSQSALDDVQLPAFADLAAADRGQRLLAPLPAAARALLPALAATPSRGLVDFANATAGGEWLAQGRIAFFLISLKPGSASQAFERALKELVDAAPESGALTVRGAFESSAGEESAKLVTGVEWLVVLAITVVTVYALVFMARSTRRPEQTQVSLILASVLMYCSASAAAAGLMGYAGIRITFLGAVAPCLGLAVGIDGTFVMVGALKRADAIEEDIPRLVASLLAGCGPGVVASWLASCTALGAALVCSRDIVALRSLCILLLTTLSLCHAGTLCVLPAMISLSEQRILAGRRDLLPWRRRLAVADVDAPYESGGFASEGSLRLSRRPSQRVSRSMSRTSSTFDKSLLDIFTLDGLEGGVRDGFLATIAPLPQESRAFRVAGSVLYAALVIFGLTMLRELQRGMPDTELARDDAGWRAYLHSSEEALGGHQLAEVTITLQSPALNDTAYAASLETVLQDLDRRPDVSTVTCWPRDLLAEGALSGAAGVEDVAQRTRGWLGAVTTAAALPGYRRAAWHGDTLQAAQCSLFVWEPLQPGARAEQALAIRGIVAASLLPATVTQPSWAAHISRYDAVADVTVNTSGTAAVCIFLVFALFLPTHVAIIAGLNVCAAVTVGLGLLSAFGFTCNVVTYCATLAGLAFAIEFTIHLCISMRYRTPPGSWGSCLRHALANSGVEVLHGCIAAVIGVSMMAFAGSVAMRTWAAVAAAIALFGAFFALVGFPAAVAFLEEEGLVWDKVVKEESTNAVVPFKALGKQEPAPAVPEEIVVEALGGKALYKGVKVLIKEEASARAAIEASGFSWDAYRPLFTSKICTVSDVNCYDGKGFKIGGCPFGWPLSAVDRIFDQEISAELLITVVEAQGLRAAQLPAARKSDPYCTVQLVGKPLTQFRTGTLRKTLDPQWNHEAFIGDFVNGDTLLFEVWDDGGWSRNRHLLGRAMLRSKHFYPRGWSGDTWVQLDEAGKGIDAKLKVKVVVASQERWAVPVDLVSTFGVPTPKATPRIVAQAEEAGKGKWTEELAMDAEVASLEPNPFALPGQSWEPPAMAVETTMTPEELRLSMKTSEKQGPPQAEEFIVDNSLLQSWAKFMRMRQTKQELNFDPQAMVFWGQTVFGHDLGDGWFQEEKSRKYLPMAVDGFQVIFRKAELQASGAPLAVVEEPRSPPPAPPAAAAAAPETPAAEKPGAVADGDLAAAREPDAAPAPPAEPPAAELPGGDCKEASGTVALPVFTGQQGAAGRSDTAEPQATAVMPVAAEDEPARQLAQSAAQPPAQPETQPAAQTETQPAPKAEEEAERLEEVLATFVAPPPPPPPAGGAGEGRAIAASPDAEQGSSPHFGSAEAPSLELARAAECNSPLSSAARTFGTSLPPPAAQDPLELALEPLPEGWEELLEDGAVYYHNLKSGMTTWSRPGVSCQAAEEETSTLPRGWRAEHDPETGVTYYIDLSTGYTTWKKPTDDRLQELLEDMESWHKEVDPITGKQYFYNPATKEAEWDGADAEAGGADDSQGGEEV